MTDIHEKQLTPEQQCIDELLTFAVLYADRYKHDSGETAFHPIHAELIDRACRLIGREPVSQRFTIKKAASHEQRHQTH